MPNAGSDPNRLPPLVVAIDGPAGSGKSTTARRLAGHLGYVYLDTGAMYRALALTVSRRGDVGDDEVVDAVGGSRIGIGFMGGEMRVLVDGEDVSEQIRTPEIGSLASRIGRLAAVRDKLVELQRRTAAEHLAHGVGVVLDGRDIGTVVFPDADVKVYMDADPAVRARRRQAELLARGREAEEADVLAEILERDRQDMERPIAPLRRADDAMVIDTSACGIDQQVEQIAERVRERAFSRSVENSSR